MTPRFSMWQMRGATACAIATTWAASELGWLDGWNWWWAGAFAVGGALLMTFGKRREL